LREILARNTFTWLNLILVVLGVATLATVHAPRARLHRDGTVVDVAMDDIVELRVGDQIGADARRFSLAGSELVGSRCPASTPFSTWITALRRRYCSRRSPFGAAASAVIFGITLLLERAASAGAASAAAKDD
jgi:hypothetical protein